MVSSVPNALPAAVLVPFRRDLGNDAVTLVEKYTEISISFMLLFHSKRE